MSKNTKGDNWAIYVYTGNVPSTKTDQHLKKHIDYMKPILQPNDRVIAIPIHSGDTYITRLD